MKKIKLSRGKYAVVDDGDYASVSKWKWFFNGRTASHSQWNRIEKKSHNIAMHRFIMKAKDGFVVDHINHDTLDNRRSNLRICSRRQNQFNRVPNRGKKYKGVGLHEGLYRAYITMKGKQIHIGYFKYEDDAARAYNHTAKKYHGEFVKLNKIQ